LGSVENLKTQKPYYQHPKIPLADGFSGDAFLHLGKVPSVQVSPLHWRSSAGRFGHHWNANLRSTYVAY
jgi:hypothetical protein